ncbi:hypothetical protein IMZ48_19135 [Candidatus Bathyarchaeota archaeon]|nr:hypothetical protein [Candidatus Bathyarchaeota archaeon]
MESLWQTSSAGHARLSPHCFTPHCEDCEANGTIYFAHQDCWKVARSRASIRSIVHLALVTHPLFSPHLVRGSKAMPLVDVLFDETHFMRRLLEEVDSRLPVELRYEVLRNLGESPMSCLLAAAQTAMLAASPPPSDKRPTTQTLEHDGPITSIHGRVSRLFGREYLVDIGFNGDEGRKSTIAVTKADITGIRFALDMHGIRAIRVKYSDKSVSPWLGNPGNAWYGEIPGNATDLRGLRLLRNVRTSQTLGWSLT